MLRYNYITIEGNIGAGKTSLANMLAQDFNGKLILEQFADNPFLPLFYKNPRQYAFPLELFFLAERYQQLKDVSAMQDLFSSFTVTDYLFAKSHLFASINLVEEEFKLFKRLSHIIQASLPEPELLLYLHSPVPVILSNIAKRGRPYEQDISGEYLGKIQQVYFDYFKTQATQRIVILDVSKINFIENKDDYRRIVSVLQEEHQPGTTMITL